MPPIPGLETVTQTEYDDEEMRRRVLQADEAQRRIEEATAPYIEQARATQVLLGAEQRRRQEEGQFDFDPTTTPARPVQTVLTDYRQSGATPGIEAPPLGTVTTPTSLPPFRPSAPVVSASPELGPGYGDRYGTRSAVSGIEAPPNSTGGSTVGVDLGHAVDAFMAGIAPDKPSIYTWAGDRLAEAAEAIDRGLPGYSQAQIGAARGVGNVLRQMGASADQMRRAYGEGDALGVTGSAFEGAQAFLGTPGAMAHGAARELGAPDAVDVGLRWGDTPLPIPLADLAGLAGNSVLPATAMDRLIGRVLARGVPLTRELLKGLALAHGIDADTLVRYAASKGHQLADATGRAVGGAINDAAKGLNRGLDGQPIAARASHAQETARPKLEPQRNIPLDQNPRRADMRAAYEAAPADRRQPRTDFDTQEIIEARAFADSLEETWPAKQHDPERRALHDASVDYLYGSGSSYRRERKAVIVLGPPSAGKSSARAEPLAAELGAVLIDPDRAKELIPEYERGLGSGAVHIESWEITNRVLRRALDAGDNIVMPAVGSNVDTIRRNIAKLKEEGYDVAVELVEIPIAEATRRAVQRFRETSRFVDPDYVFNDVGTKPLETYATLRKEGGASRYAHYSNDVPFGQEPRLIEEYRPRDTGASRSSAQEAGTDLDAGRPEVAGRDRRGDDPERPGRPGGTPGSGTTEATGPTGSVDPGAPPGGGNDPGGAEGGFTSTHFALGLGAIGAGGVAGTAPAPDGAARQERDGRGHTEAAAGFAAAEGRQVLSDGAPSSPRRVTAGDLDLARMRLMVREEAARPPDARALLQAALARRLEQAVRGRGSDSTAADDLNVYLRARQVQEREAGGLGHPGGAGGRGAMTGEQARGALEALALELGPRRFAELEARAREARAAQERVRDALRVLEVLGVVDGSLLAPEAAARHAPGAR